MAWYDTSWKARVKLTVDASLVPSDQTDFPVYVDLNDLPAHFFANVKSDGGDIRVTESDETTEVPRQVDFITVGSSIGALRLKLDLSSSVDTDFYIYYKNSGASEPAASATYGSQNVWNSAIKARYNLQDNANDSTATGANGTISGAISATGQIGDGYDFDNTDDEINSIYAVGSETYFAVAAWVKADSINGVISGQDLDGTNHTYLFFITTGGNILFRLWNTAETEFNTITTGLDTTNGSFHRVWIVKDDTTMRVYAAGAETSYSATHDTFSGTLDNTSAPFIGRREEPGSPQHYEGIIDEVEFWTGSAPTADWIATDFANQSSPGTFYAVGTVEEIDVTKTFTFDTLLQANDIDSTFTFDTLIQEELTDTFTFDALLQEEGVLSTFTFDSLLQEEDISSTFTFDSLFQEELTSTFTFDSLLQEENVSSTFTFDALFQEEGISSTFTFDSLLQEDDNSSTFTFDAILQAGTTSTFTFSALLQEDGVTEQFTFDALFQEDGISSTFTFDTLLQEEDVSSTFSFDALFQEEDISSTFTFSALLQEDDIDNTFTFDALLQDSGSSTFTFDALLVTELMTGEFTFDALLQEDGVSSTFTISALLQVDDADSTFTFDTLLQEDEATKSFTFDAILVRDELVTGACQIFGDLTPLEVDAKVNKCVY